MFKFFLSLAIFFTSIAYSSFLPENYMHLDDRISNIQNVDHDTFEKTLELARQKYAPIVSTFGYKLVIEGDWYDSTVNAYAYQTGDYWVVKMFGGLARRPEITADGFLGVICHELGHHLGGFPFVSGWAAAEGQSDYYATQVCLGEIWKNDYITNELQANKSSINPKRICDAVTGDYNERNLCIRKMEAGYSLANMLSGGRGVSWTNRDTSVVSITYLKHPGAQCRFDTYLAGSVCLKNYNPYEIYRTEYEQLESICNKNDYYGMRPRCWFKPRLRNQD